MSTDFTNMDKHELIIDILRIINYQFDLLQKIPQYQQISKEIVVHRNIDLEDAQIAVYESILILETCLKTRNKLPELKKHSTEIKVK